MSYSAILIRNIILTSIEFSQNNGNTYVNETDLFNMCKKRLSMLTCNEFLEETNYLVRCKDIFKADDKYYLYQTFEDEATVASYLADLLNDNKLETIDPDYSTYCKLPLCEEQLLAIDIVYKNRLSLITGGPGTGKTTLISAIIEANEFNNYILCSPTGKAARNLASKTGYETMTIHSALLWKRWDKAELLIIDEAGMVNLSLLAKILSRLNGDCRVVLLGDEKQLEAVGCGNVIGDLKALGIPHVHLVVNHRQDATAKGLSYNIRHFEAARTLKDLMFDKSFSIKEGSEAETVHALTNYAVEAYREGRDFQVITPRKNIVPLSATKLNIMIRNKLYPKLTDNKSIIIRDKRYYDGDRVIITKNDMNKGVCNGDIGNIRIKKSGEWYIELLTGQIVYWDRYEPKPHLELGYAITVHKAQGSEYDEVAMPIVESLETMLTRNLLFTAISRPRLKCTLFGRKDELEVALNKTKKMRKSNLPELTNMLVDYYNEQARLA